MERTRRLADQRSRRNQPNYVSRSRISKEVLPTSEAIESIMSTPARRSRLCDRDATGIAGTGPHDAIDVHGIHGFDCRDFFGRRRNRNHEHHAGDGDRTNARNRHSPRTWGPTAAISCVSFWWKRSCCRPWVASPGSSAVWLAPGW